MGLSEALFEKGQICGACFEVRCVEELRYCIPGTSIKLTVTNFCPPNYGLPVDAGGHCNPPNHHLVMPIEAFEKIAIWKAGNMPIQFRRSVIPPLFSPFSFAFLSPFPSFSPWSASEWAISFVSLPSGCSFQTLLF